MTTNNNRDENMKKLMKEFHKAFTDERPGGLPPERDIDNNIEVG